MARHSVAENNDAAAHPPQPDTLFVFSFGAMLGVGSTQFFTHMNEGDPTESGEPGDDQGNSLSLFHEAKQAAMDLDPTVAIEKLEQGLSAAEAETEPDAEWIAYIQGTLSYLREDLTGLRGQIASAGDNAHILSRLATGLERRGTYDYQEDYSA